MTPGRLLSTGQEELIVSSTLAGALLGSIVAGRLADSWGRKKVVILASVLFSLGAVGQAASGGYLQVVLGRCIVGELVPPS